jgi:hypothetical protein
LIGQSPSGLAHQVVKIKRESHTFSRAATSSVADGFFFHQLIDAKTTFTGDTTSRGMWLVQIT